MAKKYILLEEKLQKRLFSSRDLALISSMLREHVSKEEIVCLTDKMDMDSESSLYMLSLSIVGFRSGWDNFPDWAIPRLKGLHRYYQASSLAGMPWLETKMEMLSGAGIPFTMTGGLAMRAYYSSDVPRLMYGYDITIPTEDYDKAATLLRDEVRKQPSGPRERTVDGYTKILLRKGIPYAGLFSEKAFWEQALITNFSNNKARVPCPEDMLLQLFCIPFGVQLVRERNEERDRRLYDAGFVIKKGPIDFKLLADKAKFCGLESQVRFFLEIISKSAPEVFPKEKWAAFFSLDKEYTTFLKNLLILEKTIRKSDVKEKSYYRLSLSRIRAEYKLVFPIWKAQGKKTGLIAYTIETRNIKCFSDLFRHRKQEKDSGL